MLTEPVQRERVRVREREIVSASNISRLRRTFEPKV